MKLKVVATTWFLAVSVVFAQLATTRFPKLTTADGHSYTDVTITAVDATGIRFSHDSGVGAVPWPQVPADIQIALGYDAKKVAEAARQSASAKAQKQVASSNAAASGLTPELAKYKGEIENLLSQQKTSPITDIQAASQFVESSKDLLRRMAEHAQFIVAKWSQVAELLSKSELQDAGVRPVFQKQFTEEDALRNVQLVAAARNTKDGMESARVPGAERITAALLSLFSSYANLCERDRKASSEPAAFMREVRSQYGVFTVHVVVFTDQLKAFADEANATTPKSP